MGKFTVPLRSFSGLGDNRYLSPDVPLRAWTSPSQANDAAAKSRVQIGGPNGANVQERVVDATFQETADEVTPFWTADEQFVYYAANTGTGTRYQLYRLSASLANNPLQPGNGQRSVLTRETTADHRFPVLDSASGRIAFVKSTDGGATWQLYVSTNPGAGQTIDPTPGGNLNLISLTAAPQSFRGSAFASVGRAAWIGSTDLVFSARLEGEANYHLFTVNLGTRNFTQITAGSGDERNPAISPNGKWIAFDSNAAATVAGSSYTGGSRPRSSTDIGDPATATSLNSAGRRTIFVMSTVSGAPVQFTKRFTGAPNSDDVEPMFSYNRQNIYTNTSATTYYLAFASTRIPDVPGAPTSFTAGGTTHDIYVVRASSDNGQTIAAEANPTSFSQGAKQVATEDATYVFDDHYPTWSPFLNLTRIGFQSNRVGDLQANNYGGGFRLPNPPTPSDYSDIILGTVVDVTAPTLVRYDTGSATGEIIHINPVIPGDARTQPYEPNISARTREDGLLPGQEAFFTVRMDDRESGVQSVWLQFKNPNSRYQSLAQGGGGVERKEYDTTAQGRAFLFKENVNGVWIPLRFTSVGGANQVGTEYEAQVVSLSGTQYFTHSRIGGPVPTPGLSDRAAFSGSANPPLDGTGGRPNCWLQLQPLVDGNGDPVRPTDGRGGVLYGAKWRLPAEASDWYVDVIAYDNATNPYAASGSRNWIMYDNVWGFSTAVPPSPQAADILFVSDYSLGQKFFLSRPGSNFGIPANDQPVFYGAESYYTDSDMQRFPSEVNTSAPPNPGSPDTARFWSTAGPFFVTGSPVNGRQSPRTDLSGTAVNPGYVHPLGVASYWDAMITYERVTEPNATYALPNTGRYTIWRTLCRGPVPQEVLDAYLPSNTGAPADVLVGESTERSVRVSKRAIVWAAPFIGNIFVGAGTLGDLKTQEKLTNFVTQGGRLFVSGADIGFALSGNGQGNSFFTSTLKAQFVSDTGGSGTFAINATGTTLFNTDAWPTGNQHNFGRFDGTTWVYDAPITAHLNNIGPDNADSRGDAGRPSDTSLAFVDSIAAATGATSEYNYNNGAGAIIRSTTSGGGIVYYAAFGFESLSNDWYLQTPSGGSNPFIFTWGRRAEIMANFSISTRHGSISGRLIDDNGSPVGDALVRATQGALTAAAAGTAITDANGNFSIQGLAPGFYSLAGYKAGFYTQHGVGALVQAVNDTKGAIKVKRANPGQLSHIRKSDPNQEGGVFALDGVTGLGGVEVQARRLNADGTMTVSRAITSDGTDGRRPGNYLIRDLLVWDDGYEILVNSPTDPDLDANGRPVYNPDGSLKTKANTAYRSDLANIVVGKQPQTNVTLGTGTVIANKPLGTQTERYHLIISEDQTAQIDFKLGGSPQKVIGRVIDGSNNQPIQGAIVTAVDTTTGGTVAAGTTAVDGTFILLTTGTSPTELIPTGTYNFSASALGYNTVTKSNILIGGVGAKDLGDFALTALPPGSASGSVRKATGNALVGDVAIRFYVITNGIVSTTPAAETKTTATASSDGTGYTYNWRVAVLPAGTYQVIAEAPGLTTDPQPLPNLVVTSGQERKSYNFRMQPPKVYSDGIQLVSVPGVYDYSGGLTSRSVFGLTTTGDNDGDGTPGTSADLSIYNQFSIADWTGVEYNIGSTIPIQAGKGYFTRFVAPVSVTKLGTALPGTSFTINLAPGWNLIGHPFISASTANAAGPDLDLFAHGQIIDEGSTTPMSMLEAVTSGRVRGVLFGYTGSKNGAQYYETTSIKPWNGYWFRNLTNHPIKLVLNYPATRSVKEPAYRPVSRAQAEAPRFRSVESKSIVDYRVQIAARQGDLLDTDNTVGVAPDAKDGFDAKYDTQKPPVLSAAPAVYVAVEGVNESGRAASFADVVRAATPGAKSWNFTVEATQDGEVTLFWPNANRLPRGIDPYVTDLTTGKRIAIRSAASYRFAAQSRAPHRFRLDVMPAKTQPLSIVNVHMANVGGRGFSSNSGYKISFMSTQTADVQVDIQTFGGRTVKRLQTRAQPTAESSLLWDGRDERGGVLPAGAYMLVLTAQDESGTVVRKSLPFTSLR